MANLAGAQSKDHFIPVPAIAAVEGVDAASPVEVA